LILDKIFGRIQLKIKNRESAGNILAQILRDVLKNDARQDITIIGIPRGGFVIADIVATKLRCNLDMMISKRLRAPYNEELAVGAVAEDGTLYLNKSLINDLKISDEYINNEASYQLQEIKRLAGKYYHANSFLDGNHIMVNDKTIVIVDDGAATGSTILATVTSLKNKYQPKSIIVAVAVSPRSTMDLLKREGLNHLEVVTCPADSNFGSIEQFYQRFDQVDDNQILDIIHTLRK
jgi:putative phosphoribosyl transferase